MNGRRFAGDTNRNYPQGTPTLITPCPRLRSCCLICSVPVKSPPSFFRLRISSVCRPFFLPLKAPDTRPALDCRRLRLSDRIPPPHRTASKDPGPSSSASSGRRISVSSERRRWTTHLAETSCISNHALSVTHLGLLLSLPSLPFPPFPLSFISRSFEGPPFVPSRSFFFPALTLQLSVRLHLRHPIEASRHRIASRPRQVHSFMQETGPSLFLAAAAAAPTFLSFAPALREQEETRDKTQGTRNKTRSQPPVMHLALLPSSTLG